MLHNGITGVAHDGSGPAGRARRRTCSPVCSPSPAPCSFVATKAFADIVPPQLPSPVALVYASGAAELACAVGLAIPRTRRAAGWATAALFVAVFPGNVQMALDGGDRSTAYQAVVYARLPLQVPLVVWAVSVARHRQRSSRRERYRLGDRGSRCSISGKRCTASTCHRRRRESPPGAQDAGDRRCRTWADAVVPTQHPQRLAVTAVSSQARRSPTGSLDRKWTGRSWLFSSSRRPSGRRFCANASIASASPGPEYAPRRREVLRGA